MPKVLVIEDKTGYQKILKDTIFLDTILPEGMNEFDFLEQTVKKRERTFTC